MITPWLRRGSVIVFAVVSALIVGCDKDEITQYDAPRENQERLLALMMPHGKMTWWYFVLSGPAAAVSDHKADFDGLVNSVTFGDKDPKWAPLDGWKREPQAGNRFAILKFGETDPPLQITVSKLDGPMAGNVLMNVNRWREQVGLGALLESELAPFVEEATMNGTNAYRIDVTGPGGVKRDMPALPVEPITYEVPDSWKIVENPPAKIRTVKRFATFKAYAGDKEAEVSVQVFRGGGGEMDNIARWRSQVKLPKATDDEMKKQHMTRSDFKLAGQKALYADVEGDNERILAALVERKDLAWAIKIQGPKSLVAAQKDTFDKFLDSVRFSDSDGGN